MLKRTDLMSIKQLDFRNETFKGAYNSQNVVTSQLNEHKAASLWIGAVDSGKSSLNPTNPSPNPKMVGDKRLIPRGKQ